MDVKLFIEVTPILYLYQSMFWCVSHLLFTDLLYLASLCLSRLKKYVVIFSTYYLSILALVYTILHLSYELIHFFLTSAHVMT